MRRGDRWPRRLGAVGIALVISTVAVGVGTPAYGNDDTGKAPSVAKDLQQDRHDLTELKADLTHLDTEVKATLAAAAPTTGVTPAAADEVSAAIAALFNSYGQEYQALSQQAAAFHEQFAQALSRGSGQDAAAESAAAAPYVAWLQTTAQQAQQSAAQAEAAATALAHPQG